MRTNESEGLTYMVKLENAAEAVFNHDYVRSYTPLLTTAPIISKACDCRKQDSYDENESPNVR